MLNPTLDNSKAYAEELDFDTTNNISADIANVDDDSGIMVTSDSATSPAINLTIAADSGNTNGNVTVGEVAYFSNTITVGGSNIANYSLTLNTASGSNGNLVGETNSYATVGKVGSNTAPANFPDNTWGYAISTVNTTPDKATLTYNPVPGTESNNSAFLDYQKDLSGTVNNTYKLVFAAKLGSTMPSDHYQANVYISAVASATETVENWFRNAGITTMQQMSSSICASAPENATSQLRDERDGKTYWVTKLKDNNCWMTQNLDYDDGGIATPITSWPSSGTAANYYDPGDFYYDGPNNNHSQGTGCSNTTGLGDCNQFSTSGDAHYHIGNYYSWNAATAGTGGSITSGEAYGSICPSGWQLPTSKNTNSKSFRGLMNAYGISGSTNLSKIYTEPLYFVYGGNLDAGQLGAGNGGYYWSSTPDSTSTYAYRLYFSSSVDPSDGYSRRYYGYSVRCVAK